MSKSMKVLKGYLKKLLERLGLYHLVLGPYRRFAFWREHGRKYASLKSGDLHCNICGSSYKKFVPFIPADEDQPALAKYQVIGGYGDNVFCPNCESNSRERLTIAMLENEIDWKGKDILQMAPERLIHKFLKRKAKVITTDYNPERYKHVDKKIRFADITRLPFPNKSFGIVIANHILEHIPDDVKAMQEIFRVLRNGGNAILQIPYSNLLEHTIEEPGINDPKRQSELFGQLDHVRIYSVEDYIDRLRSAGFTVSLISAKDLEKYKQFVLQPNEVFFSMEKPQE